MGEVSYEIENSVNISANYLNITDNESVQDLLLDELGPKRKKLPAVILLSVVYGLIFISGTVGNVCTYIVILRNNYMRTTTNYYLLSLATSDVMILFIGLPPEAYSIWESYPWRLGKAFCIIKSLFAEMTSYASVLTITAFTIERYIAICKPLKSHKVMTQTRCIKIIIAIWIISLCCAIPYPIHTDLFFYVKDKHNVSVAESLQCNIPPKYYERMTYVFQISTFVFFVFPLTVIVVLYSLIGLTLRRSDLRRRTSDECYHSKHQGAHNNHRNERSSVAMPRKCVLKVLVAVMVAFFVCWAPFHAQRLLTIYNTNWTPLLFDVQSTLFYISGVLYFVGSTVNPILYNVMSRRYRLAFVETICSSQIEHTFGSWRRATNGARHIEDRQHLNMKSTFENKTESTILRSPPRNTDRKQLDVEKKHGAQCSHKLSINYNKVMTGSETRASIHNSNAKIKQKNEKNRFSYNAMDDRNDDNLESLELDRDIAHTCDDASNKSTTMQGLHVIQNRHFLNRDLNIGTTREHLGSFV